MIPLISLTSCVVVIEPNQRGVENTGRFQQEVQIDGIRSIRFEGPGRLHVTQSRQASLQVHGSDKALNNLRIRREGSALFIEQDSSQSFSGPLDVHLMVETLDAINLADAHASNSLNSSLLVTVPNHSKLRLGKVVAKKICMTMKGHGRLSIDELIGQNVEINMEGHGRIDIGGIKSDTLNVAMEGHGNIKLEGKTRTQIVQIKGDGFYDANYLESDNADLTTRDNSASHLWVNKKLKLNVGQHGSVHFRGTPVIGTATGAEVMRANTGS